MSASSTESGPEEAITKEGVEGTAPAPVPEPSSSAATSTSRNAFTQLMSRKRPHPPSPSSAPTSPSNKHRHHPRPPLLPKSLQPRLALGAYIANPTAYPSPSRVLYYNDRFVAVRDLYPKSGVHCLLLPRDPRMCLRHPLEVLQSGSSGKGNEDDASFVRELRAEAAKLKRLVAAELERLYGRLSKSDRARQLVLDGGSDVGAGVGGREEEQVRELPRGRDWEAEVHVGVHQRPSMAHLHVHVMTRDVGNAPAMKNARHYNSFTTPFLVRLDDFPLADDDARLVDADPEAAATSLRAKAVDYLKAELVCWRCGRGFGRQFAELRRHLDLEIEEWKRE